MFWIKNKKNRYTPPGPYPSFTLQNWGSRRYTFQGHVFLMKQDIENVIKKSEQYNNYLKRGPN